MRLVLLTSIFLFACAGPAAQSPSEVRVTKTIDQKHCVSVGVIEERIEAPSEGEELKEAIRAEVRKRAARLRATDLVFTTEEYDASYAFAKAEAYRCKR